MRGVFYLLSGLYEMKAIHHGLFEPSERSYFFFDWVTWQKWMFVQRVPSRLLNWSGQGVSGPSSATPPLFTPARVSLAEEPMKSRRNDVTGRLRKGEAGLVIEMGRPGTGAYFRDIEKVAMALAKLRPHFEKENPVTQLMVNPEIGKIKDEVLNEKVLSAIIEIKTTLDRIPEFLQALEKVQKEVDTVISVGVASKCLPDGTIPHEEWVRKAGYQPFSQMEKPISDWAGPYSGRIES